jgi:hypothetical protein
MGFPTDENGNPKSLEEVWDWQLDKSTSPPTMVLGLSGKNDAGEYKGAFIDVSGSLYINPMGYAMKITESGSDTYIAKAVAGSAQASAVWQVVKISESGADTTITWADGDRAFDNVATDLTALSYS